MTGELGPAGVCDGGERDEIFGQIQRIEALEEAYANGEIETIEELNEEVIPLRDGNFPYWNLIVSANIM